MEDTSIYVDGQDFKFDFNPVTDDFNMTPQFLATTDLGHGALEPDNLLLQAPQLFPNPNTGTNSDADQFDAAGGFGHRVRPVCRGNVLG